MFRSLLRVHDQISSAIENTQTIAKHELKLLIKEEVIDIVDKFHQNGYKEQTNLSGFIIH